jgi:hypothetical protein
MQRVMRWFRMAWYRALQSRVGVATKRCLARHKSLGRLGLGALVRTQSVEITRSQSDDARAVEGCVECVVVRMHGSSFAGAVMVCVCVVNHFCAPAAQARIICICICVFVCARFSHSSLTNLPFVDG